MVIHDLNNLLYCVFVARGEERETRRELPQSSSSAPRCARSHPAGRARETSRRWPSSGRGQRFTAASTWFSIHAHR